MPRKEGVMSLEMTFYCSCEYLEGEYWHEWDELIEATSLENAFIKGIHLFWINVGDAQVVEVRNFCAKVDDHG